MNPNNSRVKKSPNARRKARQLALQAIYQWQLTGNTLDIIQAQFIQDPLPKKIDIPYFIELVQGIMNEHSILDETIKPILDRPMEQLQPVELAILRLSTYELIYRIDIPYRVVIDEALRLAKTFGSVEGFRYVNAVLDQIARSKRTYEKTQQ